ncbi:MAG TPA: hypothetical protein VJO53_09465 [Candidatus Acidoferrales bacterium]|nr:hypothetical protein [Candidatus Acidoferrales bacterium]
MNHIDGHFDEMTGLLFLEGQLDAGRASEVSAHVASCAACGELLRALESEGVWLREALQTEDEPVPAHMISAPERGMAHWGWIAAFGLGVGGAYTLWSGFVQPWLAQAGQAGFTQGNNLLTDLFLGGAFWKGWDAMRSLMEFLAVATLGTLAIWLLRRRWHRFTAIAFVMGAVAGALAIPPSAAADMMHGNPSYTLPAGQEVKSDLFVAADHARIDGDVDGDLIVFSNNVTVDGHIKGDIIACSQELRVNGPVDGNIRAFAQSLMLNSTVGRNVMAWVQEVDLDHKAQVGGSMTLGVTVLVLDGKVAGDLLALAHSVEINGSLGRDVTIRGDLLTIGPTAEIAGQTKYTGTHQPDVSPSAKLGSPIQITVPKRGPDYSRLTYYWHRVLFWGASFLFGLLVLLLAPGFFFDASQAAKRVGPSLGFGALFLFATPIAALIACVTIVGLGVGVSAMLCYLIAVYAAQIFVGAWLGETLLGAGVGVGAAIGRLALGLAILRALRMLPFVGFWIAAIVVIWGLGALVLTIHKRMRPQIATA